MSRVAVAMLLLGGAALGACSSKPASQPVSNTAQAAPVTTSTPAPVTTSTGADKADPAQHAERMFARLDKNRDGFVTKDELPPNRPHIIEHFDANGDGKLTEQELEQGLAKHNAKRDHAKRSKADKD